METKIVFLLVLGSLLALAACLVHVPTPAQADDVPEKYHETVRKGLEYLVKNQFKDGHWEGDGGQHPVAMTGLAGLALLMERDNVDFPRRLAFENPAAIAKDSVNIASAADWLMDKCQARRDGLIFSEHVSETARYMQGHGLATLFLAGVCKDEQDAVRRKKLTVVLTRAVKYIMNAQSSQGGWYHTSKAEGHDFDSVSATVIQIQALQAAENAGIPVPNEAINDSKEYLKSLLAKFEAGAKPEPNSRRQADIVSALIGLFNDDYASTHELAEGWFKRCQAEISFDRPIQLGRDDLTHFYYSQVVFNLGGDAWSNYRTAMFDLLQSSQNKDGSWPASEGIGVGPVYATALWCTVLQLDKRSHPSRQLSKSIK